MRAHTVRCGAPSPAVYQVSGCSQTNWKGLWSEIVAGREICLSGPRPHEGTRDVVLVFSPPRDSAPICLATRLTGQLDDGFSVAADPPPLSWRLAAVDFGRRLPAESSFSDEPAWEVAPTLSNLREQRLRLRPDLPGPACTIAPDKALSELIIGLRAGFSTGEDLLDTVDAPPAAILSFLAGLNTTGLLLEAPRALKSNANPFDFFGLHWSAHDPLVRRRYQCLVPCAGDKKAVREQLEQAFDVLHRPKCRRRLRHELVQPPVIGEVTDYFHRQLREARRCADHKQAIDLCRRIVEIDPDDDHARATLRRLLCHNHPYRS